MAFTVPAFPPQHRVRRDAVTQGAACAQGAISVRHRGRDARRRTHPRRGPHREPARPVPARRSAAPTPSPPACSAPSRSCSASPSGRASRRCSSGVVVGALILCPMAVFGPVNGTNNAVSSSAHLGVHGRVVGSFLSLLTGDRVLLHLGVELRRRAGRRRAPAVRPAERSDVAYGVRVRAVRRPGPRRVRLRLPVHAVRQQGRGGCRRPCCSCSARSPSPATSTRRTPGSSRRRRTRRPRPCSGRRSSAPR